MSLIPPKPKPNAGATPGQTLVGSTAPGKPSSKGYYRQTRGPSKGDIYASSVAYAMTGNPHYEPAFSQNSTYGIETPDKVNRRASKIEATQDMIAGAGNVLPIIYGGPVKLGPLIVGVVALGETLHLTGALSHGPIQSIDKVTTDDSVDADPLEFEYRLGTPSQSVLATLVTAYAARGITYSDTMNGVAYVDVQFGTRKKLSSVPRLVVLAKGRTVLDMRTGTTAWSANPVLCAADFIKSTVYGIGDDYDVASFSDAANFNDEMVGSPAEPRCRLALAITQRQDNRSWLEVLAVYAECRIYKRGGIWYAAPRRARASSFVFNESNMVEKTVKIIRAPSRSIPTVSTVQFTDTAVLPWQTRPATMPSSEAAAGTLPWRETSITLPGVLRSTEALRKAIQRLNALNYGSTALQFAAFDEAITVNPGSVVTVTNRLGLVARLFEVNEVVDYGFGRYGIAATSYDARIFSSVAQPITPPIDASVGLPVAGSIGLPVFATAAEELYQTQTGSWATRLRFTWTYTGNPSTLDHYSLVFSDVTSGSVTLDARDTSLTAFTSYAIQEGHSYRLAVTAVGPTGAASAVVNSATVPVLGKSARPGDVPTLTGFEAGGRVFLYWSKAIDLDIWRYEIRYGATTGTWATAKTIDVVDALAYEAPGVPAGPWRFYVKAIDSVRNESVNAKTLDLTVTLDSAAFVLGAKFFDELGPPTLLSMTPYNLRGNPITYYVSDFNDPISFGYTNQNNATGTFADDGLAATEWPRPHGAGVTGLLSEYLTQTWDVGQAISGNFTGTIIFSNVGNIATAYIETSLDSATWTQAAGLSAKTTARFVRLRVTTAPNYGTMLVESGASVRIDAYPRTENGVITTNASGRTVVNLGYKYAAAKTIQLTPQGTASRSAVYDNIILSQVGANSFDVYLFNSAMAQISGVVSWVFQGV